MNPTQVDLEKRRNRIIVGMIEMHQDTNQSSRQRLRANITLIRLDKQIRHERHLKGQQDPSEEAAAIVFGEISSGTRLSWRFRFFPMALVPKSATSLEKIEWEPVYHGDFPKKKRRSRQNRRPSNRLGKFDWEPVYHGDRETKRDPIGEPFRIGEAIRISEAARTRPPQNSEPPSSPPDFQGNAVYHGIHAFF